jgi:hypothetical protein
MMSSTTLRPMSAKQRGLYTPGVRANLPTATKMPCSSFTTRSVVLSSGWHDVADLPSNLYFGVDQTAPSSPADSGSGYDYSGSDFGSSDSSDAGGDF